MEHPCYTLKSQSRKYNHRKPESSPERLDRSLFVVFGIQDLFATHCTDAFFVGAALAVMRTWLVYRTFTNSASGELIFSIRIKSCFFRSQSFVFIQLPSTTFCGVPCAIFPCIWSDNSAEFLFTFFAHHPSTNGPLNRQRRSSGQKTSTTQPEKASPSGYVSPFPLSASRFSLSLTRKAAGGSNES